MTTPRVIFISAVSDEFHRCPPEKRHLFPSYRDVLEQAFRRLAPCYEVVLQETLPVGPGDLLETLDQEVSRSLLVIHLAGEMAGMLPETDSVARLFARYPELLERAPTLRAAVGDGAEVSITQWELYFAIHHGKPHQIFLAHPEAPRSPHFAPTPRDLARQQTHLKRIDGKHRGWFTDQGDLARQSIRSFLHFRADPQVDPREPSTAAIEEAWRRRHDIVNDVTARIRKPDPREVPVADPANVAAFVAAVRAAATRWHVNLATIVDVAARHEADVRAAAEAQPSPRAMYEVAFANLALNDLANARFWARRALDLARRMLQDDPENGTLREMSLNALLLLFEHAKGTHDVEAAIEILGEVNLLLTRTLEPILWADVNEPFAEFLLAHARFEESDALISDIVDIREEHQSESSALAVSLVLWARWLNERADYRGAEAVARRAEGIFAGQSTPHPLSLAAAMTCRGEALLRLNRPGEAEPVLRAALNLTQTTLGEDHPHVGVILGHVAFVDVEANRPADAEANLRRALEIEERHHGDDDVSVATALNNLADLLRRQERLPDAELLLRRALAIDERHFGAEHTHVARDLENLGRLLTEMNQLEEAELRISRALEVDNKLRGLRHPISAGHRNNLAYVCLRSGRLEQAEMQIRQALEIWEETLGPDHYYCAVASNSLGHVFYAKGQLAEASSQFRDSLTRTLRGLTDTAHPGAELPKVINNYAAALSALGRSQQEIQEELDGLFRSFGLKFVISND